MATVTPEETPNPNAMKFNLDVTLAETFNVSGADRAPNDFARQVIAVDGVASLFGTANFVTVTRQPDADWGPIIAAVGAAAAEHL